MLTFKMIANEIENLNIEHIQTLIRAVFNICDGID